MGSEWTDKECQTCSVCLTSVTASVNADERTRLLGSRQETDFWADLCLIGLLFLFLCAGVGIGAYLLINEDQEWQLDEVYSIVTREEWGAADRNSSELKRLRVPVGKVLLVDTKTNHVCYSKGECLKDVKNLQTLHQQNLPDIGYNFLVGGDGRIYEGRGQDYQCEVEGYTDENTLTIGILGTFTTRPPSHIQIDGLKILLDYGKQEGFLKKCYTVITQRDEHVISDVAVELQREESFDC